MFRSSPPTVYKRDVYKRQALFPVRLTKNLMLLPVEIALLYIVGKAVQKISRRVFAA